MNCWWDACCDDKLEVPKLTSGEITGTSFVLGTVLTADHWNDHSNASYLTKYLGKAKKERLS